jgi:hypothetical protein
MQIEHHTVPGIVDRELVDMRLPASEIIRGRIWGFIASMPGIDQYKNQHYKIHSYFLTLD